MRITTKFVIDWHGNILEHEFYEYHGLLELAKGPSVAQTTIANDMSGTYAALNNAWATAFSGQQAILGSLRNAAQGIVAAGPNQYGFSPTEQAALETQAIGQTATTFAANQQALNEALAARGGGNAFLPSGAAAQLQGQGYQAAAGQESQLMTGITEAGYAQGRQNWQTALGVLGQTAALEAPSSMAAQASAAGKEAFAAQTQIAAEQAAASPWGAIGGALGGIAGAVLGGPAGAQLGAQFGQAVGGAASGSSWATGPGANYLSGGLGQWGGVLGGGSSTPTNSTPQLIADVSNPTIASAVTSTGPSTFEPVVPEGF
jgi:hypothetical protein